VILGSAHEPTLLQGFEGCQTQTAAILQNSSALPQLAEGAGKSFTGKPSQDGDFVLGEGRDRLQRIVRHAAFACQTGHSIQHASGGITFLKCKPTVDVSESTGLKLSKLQRQSRPLLQDLQEGAYLQLEHSHGGHRHHIRRSAISIDEGHFTEQFTSAKQGNDHLVAIGAEGANLGDSLKQHDQSLNPFILQNQSLS